MQVKTRTIFRAWGAALVATLAACGGGGGGGGTTAVAPTAPSQLSGTAATGAALANASVAISNTGGTSPCTEAAITTSPLGSFTCTLKAGETAPFFIVVTDPSGNTAPLVSIATVTPAAGTPLLVNATPLTTAIVAQLNGGDALGVVGNKALYVPASFAAIKANVIAQIRAVVASLDPALGNYDPFTTSITAATAGNTGNTADQILDVIKITRTSAGSLAIATISDPTPIAMATATLAGASIPAPAVDVADLAQSARLAAQAFMACFALPVSQRVTLDGNGNITAAATQCQSMVTLTDVPTGAPAFKSNGYGITSEFYGYLTSSLMTGARFSVPEIMAYYPIDSDHTRARAVMNIRYLDNTGRAGNYITVAQNFPNSSTASRPSNWWITGNQWDYDLAVKTDIRRVQEMNASITGTSRYQNGLSIFINSKSGAPHGGGYDAALVTGPGLPTTGLWYAKTNVSGQFAVTTNRSTAPQLPANLSPVCPVCSTFWMSKTTSLGGSSLAANTTTVPYTYQWAGSADGSYNGVDDAKRPVKGSVYTFRIYSNGTLVATEKRTLLSELVPAVQARNMQWHGIGSQTTRALDINNTALVGVQSSLPIDWLINPAAETIKDIWVSQTNGGFENATPLALGASSVVATPYSNTGTPTTFTAMSPPFSNSTAPFGGYREIGFNYRMLDGSSKNAIYSYYPK